MHLSVLLSHYVLSRFYSNSVDYIFTELDLPRNRVFYWMVYRFPTNL